MKENLAKELADARSNARYLPMYGRGGTFLDCGSNIGEVSRMASEYFDSVIAIEAHPETFARGVERCRHLNNIKFINAAVWSENGNLMFVSSPENSTGATARPQKRLKGAGEDYYKQVESVSFSDLINCYSPRVIKMDIEGAEYEVLNSTNLNIECEWISIEFHGTQGQPAYRKFLQIDTKLIEQGFNMVLPKNISLKDDKLSTKAFYFVAVYNREKR